MQWFQLTLASIVMISACGDATDIPVNKNQSPGARSITVSAPTDPATDDNSRSSASRDGLGKKICKYRINESSKNLEVFDVSSRFGGRTCYLDKKVWLYLPQSGGACGLGEISVSDAEAIPIDVAEAEFLRCTAINKSPSERSPNAILFSSPASLRGIENNEYRTFVGDVQALVTNDGLEVTYYTSQFGVICLEVDNTQRVVQHIQDSGIPRPSEIAMSLHKGSCGPLLQAQNQSLISE